jgi:DNA-binding MarR family transcriptional regulator
VDDPFEGLDDLATLWMLVRRAAAVSERQGEALFRTELGISLPQFLVLSVVDAHPGALNQQTVADRLGLTKGTVSRQIEQAVAAGLMHVAPSAVSRRENVVTLTREGTALVRRGDAVFAAARQDAPALDPADIAAALRVLQALAVTG